jgi:hypothetical protein
MAELLETGGEPRNPTVAYERRDVSVRGLVWFVIGLAILIVITLAIVFWLNWRFAAQRARQTKSDYPLADQAWKAARKADPAGALPPAPRLEGVVRLPAGREAGRTFPPGAPEQHDVGRLEAASRAVYDVQEAQLESWSWADADHTAARIPISEAMRRLLAKPGDQLKAKPAHKPAGRDNPEEQRRPK